MAKIPQKQSPRIRSIKNTAPGEVAQILHYVEQNPGKRIGIITPFVNQKTLINDELNNARIQNASCGTVHAFQGDEKDVILIHDDLLATGGTAKAAYKLVQHFHPKKIYINFIIEITDEGLHGRDEFEGVDLTTLLTI